MSNLKSKTTKINKPKVNHKRYAPQIPDINRPDLGKPAPILAKAKTKRRASKS